MLNNLTNLFNLITGRMVKTTTEPSDLIVLGTKDPRYDGGYKPTVITVEDLLGNVAVNTDGTTIIGNGSATNPLIAVVSGVPVTYSRVCFVDAINGVNATGAINIFDKPFLTVDAAIVAATALIGIDADNRALVYIRRGAYVNTTLLLTNNVDFYCEPGVVFTGNSQIIDSGASVTSNVYGSLKMNSAFGITITGSSFCTIEFDQLITYYPSIQVLCPTANNRVTITGNYTLSSGFSAGSGNTIRNASNVSLNIKHSMNCQHHVITFRFFTGTATVNCPNINLTAGNIYGGNFKSAIGVYDAQTTGKITVNANLNCTDTVNYGGVGSTLLFFANAIPKFILNGNINGGVLKAIDGNTYGSGVIEINGNMSSSNQYTTWAYGSGQIVFKNSVIINTGTTANSYAVAINGTAKVFFKNCYFYNGRIDSDLIVINGVSTNLVVDNCQGNSPGTGGKSIISTAGVVTARIHSSRFNKGLNADVTDLYSPTGMIVDTNTIVPTVII
jgi:hypothetical protein